MSDGPTKPFPEASGKTMLLLHQMHGGLISTADLAIKIGEVLCEAHYGKDELERQRPLFAVDNGARWRIEGSWNRDRKIDGRGAFFVSIEKYDGRVTDIGAWWNYRPHPSVIPIIEQHLRGKKPGDTE